MGVKPAINPLDDPAEARKVSVVLCLAGDLLEGYGGSLL